MTFVTDALASLRRHWAKRIQYDVCFSCPKCGKRKPLKDCLKKKSLRCGMHIIAAESVRAKFGKNSFFILLHNTKLSVA